MSYSFYLFELGENRVSVAAAHAWLQAQEQALAAGAAGRGAPPVWIDELRAALSKRHPDLRRAAVATDEQWAPYQAFAETDDGVEISLYADSVSVTIPFWHSGQRAEHVLLRVSDYLNTVRGVTGFVVYDPQLDKILRLPGDLPQVAERYIHGTTTLRQFAEQRLRRSETTGADQATARRKPDERMRGPAVFGAWIAAMDASIEALRTLLPGEVAGQLDFSPGSLEALERWILDRYATVDQVFAADETLTHEYLARYVGETIRRNAGGEWRISFDDPNNAYYGVPVIHVGRSGWNLAPKYLVSASVDRRTGHYLRIVTTNQIGEEPPRNPNR